MTGRPVAAGLAIGLILGAAGGRGSTAPQAARAAVVAPATPSPPVTVRRVTVGRSVLGRPIVAHVVGEPAAPRRILVVGCVHGNERAGEAITRRLRAARPPAGTVWWIIDQANPDGCRARTRGNAHGVDLNRNAPWHWRVLDPPGGLYYAGPRPLSEPESVAINRLVRRLRPAVSIWYHQHARLVDTSSGGSRAVERDYARQVGLPLGAYGAVPGSITAWQDATFAGSTAFVVELSARPLTATAVARHVAAIRALSAQP